MIHISNSTYTIINTQSISHRTIWSKVVLLKLRATALVKIILHHLSNPEVHLHVNSNSPMNPALKQFNFVHTLTLYFCNISFNAHISQEMTFAPLSDYGWKD
jgi:hypothetical protein